MSALPPKADIPSAERNVRLVPKADIAPFIDHVVGAPQASAASAIFYNMLRPHFAVDAFA
jgi:hypothetical protein